MSIINISFDECGKTHSSSETTASLSKKTIGFQPIFPNFNFSKKPPLKTYKRIEKRQRLKERIDHAASRGQAGVLKAIFLNIPANLRLSLLNEPDENEYTPLFKCALSGNAECMLVLLETGADPKYTNSSGENCIHIAARKGHFEILRCFLEASTKEPRDSDCSLQNLIDKPDYHGNTPLLHCALSGSVGCMNLLLDAGASRWITNSLRQNFIHIAVQANQSIILEHFLERSMQAEKGGNKFLCENLLNESTQDELFPFCENLPDESIQDEMSPLLHCAASGSIPCMRLLLQNGADPLKKTVNGENFLHIAAKNGHAEIIEDFLKTVPDKIKLRLINQRNYKEETPLFLCCRSGHLKCLDPLVQAGAELMTLNKKQQNPYTLALKDGHQDVACALRKKAPELEGFFSLSIFTHVFGIEPTVTLKESNQTITIDQGSFAPLMHQQFLQLLQQTFVRKDLRSMRMEPALTELVPAFSKTCISQPSAEELAHDVRQGKLVVLPCGWNRHCIDLVFRDGYLVICNRGEGSPEDASGRSLTFVARKIALSAISVDLMQQILEKKNLSSEEGKNFFYEELPLLLSGEEDAFCQDLHTIAPKDSKAEVCTYAAGKAALRAALALITKNPYIARILTKKWATMERQRALALLKKTPSPLTQGSLTALTNIAKTLLKKRRPKTLSKRRKSLKFAFEPTWF